MSEMNCPVCGHKGICVEDLSAEFLLTQLSGYFAEMPPSSLNIGSYHILRCSKCSLEYANPMVPGTPAYYEWIAGHRGYYPASRWDHETVKSLILSAGDGSVLDVGCGSGAFLTHMAEYPGVRAVGLDLNASAVNECRKKGLIARCSTLRAFADCIKEGHERFDHIVAFHCLEHVQDPLGFVRSMKSILRPEGRIYLSTPYSPMSFEYNWFDIQNHPPHHLTRWNIAALSCLANQVGMDVQFTMPKASSMPSRLLSSIRLRYRGVGSRSFKAGLLLMVRHPWSTATELICQEKREKVDGRIAANVVLAMLSAR